MLHGLVAICHEAGNGGYIGSHCPKQLRASSLLGGAAVFWYRFCGSILSRRGNTKSKDLTPSTLCGSMRLATRFVASREIGVWF